jgi:AsmA protein
VKKILAALAVLVILLVAAVIAAPFLIPAETIAGLAATQVKEATGRELRIAGPVRLSLLPRLEVEANDVAFANAPGSTEKDMARIKSLQLRLALMPLLSREVALDGFVMKEPVIHLEVDKQGRPNWAFQPAASAPQAPQPTGQQAPAKEGGGLGLADIRLGDIQIENGRLTYVDHRSGARQELRDLDLKLKLPSLEKPLEATGSLIWRDKKVSLDAAAQQPRALLDGGTSPISARIEAETIKLSVKGAFTNAAPPKIEGDVDLAIPSVRNLAAWAGTPLDMPGSGLGPLSIAGKLALAGPKISFTNARLGLDEIKGTGEVRLDAGGARPFIAAKLDLEKLDLNPYLPPENAPAKPAAPPAPASTPAGKAPAAPAPTPAAQDGWSAEPIDLAPLTLVDLDLDLGARELRYRKIAVDQARIAAKLKDGRLAAELKELALYRGKGQGSVQLDGSKPVPHVALAFKLDGVAAEPLLKDAADFDRLTGTGALEFDVAGDGKSQRDLVASLGGKGALAFREGTIRGIDLANIANVAQTLTGGQIGVGGETAFSELGGTFRIERGILRNDDLALKSPVLTASGSGSVDLPRRTIDYRVTPRILQTNFSVPVAVKGPWDKLSYVPDVGGLLQQGIQQGIPRLLAPPSGQTGAPPPAGQPPRPQDVLRGILGR